MRDFDPLITIAIGGVFLQEASRLGASRWVKAKMYGNYVVDLLVGLIPLVGDAFDFGFKAHRRNLRLLEQHVNAMRSHGQPSQRPAAGNAGED